MDHDSQVYKVNNSVQSSLLSSLMLTQYKVLFLTLLYKSYIITQMFNKGTGKISGFLIAYRLYIQIRIRDIMVKEQVQWVLSYMQKGSADIQKENIIKNLESRNLSYVTVEEFLSDLKEEFSREDDKIMKMVELKKIE